MRKCPIPKRGETFVPFFAYGNSSPSVVFHPWRISVFASAPHTIPNAPEPRSFPAVNYLADNFATSARFDVPANKVRMRYNVFGSAFAPAHPFAFAMWLILNKVKNSQLAIFMACKISSHCSPSLLSFSHGAVRRTANGTGRTKRAGSRQNSSPDCGLGGKLSKCSCACRTVLPAFGIVFRKLRISIQHVPSLQRRFLPNQADTVHVASASLALLFQLATAFSIVAANIS